MFTSWKHLWTIGFTFFKILSYFKKINSIIQNRSRQWTSQIEFSPLKVALFFTTLNSVIKNVFNTMLECKTWICELLWGERWQYSYGLPKIAVTKKLIIVNMWLEGGLVLLHKIMVIHDWTQLRYWHLKFWVFCGEKLSNTFNCWAIWWAIVPSFRLMVFK